MSEHHSNKEFEENMALIDMNHLRYEACESVCATSNANTNLTNFSPNSMSNCIGGEQPSIIFNTGASYTDALKSFIQVTLTVNITGTGVAATDPAFFAFGNNDMQDGGNAKGVFGTTYKNGGGSILNLLCKEVNHQSKSGELLYRELFKNQVASTSRLYKIDKSRRGYIGTNGGAQINPETGLVQYPIFPVGVPVTFQLGLSEISDFFGCASLIMMMVINLISLLN